MPPRSLILPAPCELYTRRRRWLGLSNYWTGQSLFWGGLCAFLIGNSLANPKQTEQGFDLWAGVTAIALCGWAITHLLRVVLIALRRRATSWAAFLAGLVPLNLLGAAGLVGAILGLTLVVNPSAFEKPDAASSLAEYFSEVGFLFALLWVWTGFYLGYCYYRSYREGVEERLRLQTAVKDAELRTLKAQVNPHFLFNSLNTLRSMIPEDMERPREAVTLLAEMLRASLTLGDRATVRLDEEIETVETYLALERLRFEQRLQVRACIDAGLGPLLVPPFVLQTLVENAVKFGVGGRSQGGEVAYAAFLRDGALHLRVTNPGRVRTSSNSTGLGLANARERLAHLFGPATSITLSQEGLDLVVAEAILPAVSALVSHSSP